MGWLMSVNKTVVKTGHCCGDMAQFIVESKLINASLRVKSEEGFHVYSLYML